MKICLFFICLLAIGSVQAAIDPQLMFNRACIACHNGQLPIAPKQGDRKAWQPKLEKGNEVLLKHVTEGFSIMPPKGMCNDCTAEDLSAVIDWMSSEAGSCPYLKQEYPSKPIDPDLTEGDCLE